MKDMLVIGLGILAGVVTWALTQSDIAAGIGAIAAVILASALVGKREEPEQQEKPGARAKKQRGKK